jgi:hypothetical protein
MIRPLSRRVRPRLEVLEDRCTPSTLTNFLNASGLSHLLPDGSDGTAPFSGFNQNLPTQTVPIEIAGSGEAPQGIPVVPGNTDSFTSTGLTNLTGGYTGTGTYTLLSYTGPTTGTFQGTFDYVAGNGDTLAVNFGAGSPGTFTVTPVGNGKVIAQFVTVGTPIPSECTGRFAGVVGGGFTGVAVTEPFDPTPNAQGFTPPFKFSWEAEGMLVEKADPHQTHVPFVPLPLTYAAPSLVAPFETAGAGHAPQGVPLFAGGMASHDATGGINLLGTFHGKYSGNTGEYTFLGFTSPTTGDFHGQYDFIASNGDQLPCTYGAASPGTLTIFPQADGKIVVQFIAVFAPITSETTGRFTSITGGNFMMIATTDPFDPTPNAQGFTEAFTYSWVGAGLFLENPAHIASEDDQGIISLLEFGENAAAIAASADPGDGDGNGLAGLSSQVIGSNEPARFAAPPAQPAISNPLVASFIPPSLPGARPPTDFSPAGRPNPTDVDRLFSALNTDSFAMAS